MFNVGVFVNWFEIMQIVKVVVEEKVIDCVIVIEVMQEVIEKVVKFCYGQEYDICVVIDYEIGEQSLWCVQIVVMDEDMEDVV